MLDQFIGFIREKSPDPESVVALHQPEFSERDKELVVDAIDSTFVSSVGKYVDRFETQVAKFVGANHAIAVVNGTAGLHLLLHAIGVKHGDLVITQSLTFIATVNAIIQCGAQPVLLDVAENNLSLDPIKLAGWLNKNSYMDDDGQAREKLTHARISAVMPMHTFGHCADLDKIEEIVKPLNIPVIEDAAEALGSQHTDRFVGGGESTGVFSFNGNKTLTTGGGGVVVTSDSALAARLKSLSTTSKKPHPYEYHHLEPAFNYRLPNLNAALGCAQLEVLEQRLAQKRKLAMQYRALFKNSDFTFVNEPEGTVSNYWLNAIICPSKAERDEWLVKTNELNIGARPIWQPMHLVPYLSKYPRGSMTVTTSLSDRILNLPSSAYLGQSS